MSAEDWIQQLVKEDTARREAEYNYNQLTYKIEGEAENLLKQILEAVRRDVERVNNELYHANILEVETNRDGFTISKEYTPATTMRVELVPDEHALEYTLIVHRDANSYPSQRESERIEIIVGQGINDLRFKKGNHLLLVDNISRMLIEPIVRAAESEEE